MVFEVYFYTLITALLSTALAVVVGSVAAYFTAQRKFFGRNLLLSTSAVPLCVPPLVVALGFVSFFGVNGAFNHLFHSNKAFLYTTAGVIIAQGFYNFPYVLGILNDAIENLPKPYNKENVMFYPDNEYPVYRVCLRQTDIEILED